MAVTVQKFGGTSLQGDHSRQHVLRHITREFDNGSSLVVVVSAMGRKGDPFATDTLIDFAEESGVRLAPRERDLLLSCGELISASLLAGLLQSKGIPAIALSGGQAGIVTDDRFGAARILNIRLEPLQQHLAEGRVAVVAGFQGSTKLGDVTTLGRGGSDTTATALAAALRADLVEIYTDVDGILTADPRLVSEARHLPVVSYEEICNMAHNGAKVIHPRAVEIAMKAGVPVRVRSTFSDGEGTLVTNANTAEGLAGWTDRTVTGLAHVTGVTQLSVTIDDAPADLQVKVFQAMAKNGISVDLINVMPNAVLYTVAANKAELAVTQLAGLGFQPRVVHGCAKVSVIGGGMNGEPGVMAKIVEALTNYEIPILQSADSNTTIWVLVKEEDMPGALQALHRAFGLHAVP